jgi:glycosyltransferase involved in cell wall biosynthesis
MSEVTVVIPAYNAAATIGAAVDSALDQTLGEVEVVVVDDGSTDATAARARREGDLVTVVRTPNQGVSAARNEGVGRAQGRFIAFLDADDLWVPAKLERQIEALDREPEAAMAVSGSRVVNSQGRTLEITTPWRSDDPCRDLLLHSMVMGHVSSAVLRRDELERMGAFDRRFSQCADWDLFLRIASTSKLAPVMEPLVVRRVHRENMSGDVELLERDTFAVLDSFFSSPGSERFGSVRRRVYSNHWMILSGSYLHAGKPRASLRCLGAALRLYPGNVRRPLGAPSRWVRRLASRRGSSEQPAQ